MSKSLFFWRKQTSQQDQEDHSTETPQDENAGDKSESTSANEASQGAADAARDLQKLSEQESGDELSDSCSLKALCWLKALH